MEKLDPRALALRQVELDARRTCEFAEVLSRKRARMRASPLAFLRGSATLYYEMLRARGELESGPSGTSQLVGDAHLENFGAFTPARAPGAPEEKRPVTFDLNDFDESLQGPVHWDVCRLTTSLIAGGRELGVDGGQVLQLSRCLLDSYVHTAFDGQPAPEPPRPVRALCEQVQKRSRSDLLDDRTTVESGHRRFRLGPRYLALPAEYSAQLPGALLRYASTLRDWERPRPDQLAIVDAAFRVAGTGSLGALRIAVLVHGKGGEDGGHVFDLKEQLPSSAASVMPAAQAARAESVVEACRLCLPEPPRQLGSTSLQTGNQTKSLVVRRLSPQEDKLTLAKLERDDLVPLANYLGALLGRAHARAAERLGLPLPTPWSAADRSELLARAVSLAGLHEATYLEYCLLTDETPS